MTIKKMMVKLFGHQRTRPEWTIVRKDGTRHTFKHRKIRMLFRHLKHLGEK